VRRSRFVIRVGLPRAMRSPFVLASTTIHVALAAAVVLVPSLRARPQFPDSFAVNLVAPGPPARSEASRPAPPRPAPPQPKPETPPDEGVRVETSKPRVTEKKPVKEEKREAPSEPVADPVPPGPVAPEADLGGPEDDPGVVGDDSGEVGGGIGGGESDAELAWYQSSVTAALYGNWQRPVLSGLRESLEVGIEFEILRDGRVRGLRVTRTSGVPSLDRSALRAVSDASPLPPIPSHWPDASVPARFVFRLHPEQL